MVGIELESRLSNSQFRLIQIDTENCFFLRKKKEVSIGLISYLLRWIKARVPFPFDNQRMEISVELKFTTYKCLLELWDI